MSSDYTYSKFGTLFTGASAPQGEQGNGFKLDSFGNYDVQNKSFVNVNLIDGDDVHAHITSTTAHGTTSAILGKDDSQTITNKTINSASNTIQVSGTNINDLVNQDVRTNADPTFDDITTRQITFSSSDNAYVSKGRLRLGESTPTDTQIILFDSDNPSLSGGDAPPRENEFYGLSYSSATNELRYHVGANGGPVPAHVFYNGNPFTEILRIPKNGIVNNNNNTNLLTLDGTTLKYRTLASTQSFGHYSSYLATTFTALTNTGYTINWTEDFDTIGITNTADYVEVPLTGIYNITYRVGLSLGNNYGFRQAYMTLDNRPGKRYGLMTIPPQTGASVTSVNVSISLYLETGERFRTYIYHNDTAGSIFVWGNNDFVIDRTQLDITFIRKW